MYVTKLQVLTLGAALQAVFTAATPTTNYCSQTITADYTNIAGAAIVSKPLPRPYKGLNYVGWAAVTNANIAGIQGSVLQVQSPPTSIFFGEQFGKTSTTNTFTVTSDYNHFTLTSLYFACVAAPDGSVGLGGAAGGVNVPTGCTVRAVGTKTDGSTVGADLTIGPVLKQQLFRFPITFVNLKSVNFVLLVTNALSGVTDVDFDNVQYTLYKTC
ncbi:MAG: hypothetical protein Q9225_005607 [Loekoesia sp. 1 TL-2023]